MLLELNFKKPSYCPFLRKDHQFNHIAPRAARYDGTDFAHYVTFNRKEI
jgi:hypothetical protein